MRNCSVITGAALTLLAVHVQAQTAEPQGPQPSEPVPEPPPVVEATEEKWSFSASLTLYVVPTAYMLLARTHRRSEAPAEAVAAPAE